MKKATKIALITAAVLIVLGLILAALVFASSDPFSAYQNAGSGTIDIEHKDQQITEAFDSIEITDVPCDVQILPSTDGKCSVSYTDSRLFTHEIRVKDGTLTIQYKDISTWMDNLFTIYTGELYVNVYLPENAYEELDIQTTSGNVRVAEDFTFEQAELSSTSGDITFLGGTTDELELSTTSGSVEVSGADHQRLDASSTSGQVTLSGLTAQKLSASSVSGDVRLENVTVLDHTDLETTSGDIILDRLESGTLSASAVSGSISGTTTSPKDFDADTVSGNIRLPDPDATAGRWDLSTTSGSIHIEVKP